MKFSYFMVLILVIVGAFQYVRTTEMSEHYSLEQIEEFQLEGQRDGTLEIKAPQRHLVLYAEGEGEKEVYGNLMESFKFSKVNYDVRSLFGDIGEVDGYTSIIVISSSYIGMPRDNFDIVGEFLEEGGNLIFLSTSNSSPFNPDIGITGTNGYIATEGIVFKEKFFPGLEDLRPSEKMMPGSSVDVDLGSDIKVIAVDNYDTPLIWERKVGKGRIINANTTLFEGKMARGVLSQLIAYGNDYFIMPVFNSKVVHLDDFPAPIPDGINKTIHRNYHMKTRSFFKNIWWKDMEGIGKRQNIKYTGFLIGQYNDIVDREKMGIFFEIHKEDLGYFGRKLFQNGGELGIHGYNHLSLAMDGGIDFKRYNYKPWKSEENIIFALKSLGELMDDLYGEKVRVYSYVPPTNLITKEGKAALLELSPPEKFERTVYSRRRKRCTSAGDRKRSRLSHSVLSAKIFFRPFLQ